MLIYNLLHKSSLKAETDGLLAGQTVYALETTKEIIQSLTKIRLRNGMRSMKNNIQYLRVAVCDGNEKRIIQIEGLLEKAEKEEGVQMDVDTMRKGSELVERIARMETYDIIYIGMELEDTDSVALAGNVRERDEESYLFFLGTEEKRLGELYPGHTMQYNEILYGSTYAEDYKFPVNFAEACFIGKSMLKL